MKMYGMEVKKFVKAKDLWISAKQDEEFTKNAIRDYAFEDGEKSGEQKGIKKNQITTAKNMLEENCDIKFISRITGLSKKEIEKLKE